MIASMRLKLHGINQYSILNFFISAAFGLELTPPNDLHHGIGTL
jgi:hypothetical protein